MGSTRRQLLAATALGSVSIAGCVEGELADTTYNCEVNEPESIPSPSRPTIGDSAAPVTVEIYHDYSEEMSSLFAVEVLEKLLNSKADTGTAEFKFYDLPAPGQEDWAFQLASVGRYLFAEHGPKAYRQYLLSIYEYQQNLSWQIVGNIAENVGADACTTISHGSWKTYEKATTTDKERALADGISVVPALKVNGSRVRGLAPVSESYEMIASEIDKHADSRDP